MKTRVLLAPVTITPTKPLSPSHLKGLLWTDVMFRATSQVADVTYRCSHTTYHPTEQTLGFWEYLDRTQGDIDYSGRTAEEIGDLYVGYRSSGQRSDMATVQPYLDAIEQGWVHPASSRMLQLWAAQYERLGMYDPGLTTHQPPGMSLEEMIDCLNRLDMCLDQRSFGGPVYLDATKFGIPLRKIVGSDRRPNYLACALRELAPLVPQYDEVVLLYDSELEQDYLLLQRTLSQLGPVVHRVPLGRVPINGVIRSARHGGWHECSVDALLNAHENERALRLGMRLYFIAMLGPGSQESFRPELLRRWLNRAERILSDCPRADSLPLADFLKNQRSNHAYIDPYRLMSSLIAKHGRAPTRELFSEVLL